MTCACSTSLPIPGLGMMPRKEAITMAAALRRKGRVVYARKAPGHSPGLYLIYEKDGAAFRAHYQPQQ